VIASNTAAAAEFRRETLTVNGVRVVVLMAGSGEPLVFFHGAGTFHGFDFALPWASRYRVIIPYHPGWGDSGDAPGLTSLHDYVLHYLDTFDQLQLQRFNLVGFSLGGLLAATFAIEHAHRLRKLVLVAPPGMYVPDHPAPDISQIPPEQIPGYLVEDVSVIARHLPQQPSPEFLAARQRELQSLLRVRPNAAWSGSTLPLWLHRVTSPAMILWGEKDRLVPVQHADVWARYIPGARVRRFPGAGHLVLDENPEAVAAVAEFLR
jgi:pimeloyl-ACP methyl ester carboxylesterase